MSKFSHAFPTFICFKGSVRKLIYQTIGLYPMLLIYIYKYRYVYVYVYVYIYTDIYLIT